MCYVCFTCRNEIYLLANFVISKNNNKAKLLAKSLQVNLLSYFY